MWYNNDIHHRHTHPKSKDPNLLEMLILLRVPQHVDVAEAKEGKKSDDIATLHFAEPWPVDGLL